eukprot:gene2312-8602_t
MTQFSTFDLFGPLPSPSGASREFLHQIGLQPEPFQEWMRSIDAGLANSSNWSDVLRLYVQHCETKFNYTDDPLAELQQYGLTRELSDKIINTAGDHYGAMLPSQYVVSAVETTLSMALSSR